MTDEEAFVSQTDYTVPLLRLLAELPDGQDTPKEVRRLFENRYGHLIPDEHRRHHDSGEIIWENNVNWSRLHLKQYGFLDSSVRGIWRITDAGRQWLEDNPTATHFKSRPRNSSSRPRAKSSKSGAVPGITLEMLEQTRKLMPTDQFRQVWGALYDQLLAEERTKAVTQIAQRELSRRTRRWLDDVHAFLSGKNASPPSSEVLCDWIQFCYVLELYREAAALLPYVDQGQVDAAIYKRAKRIAEVCQSKRIN
jgi:hypothetical protein